MKQPCILITGGAGFIGSHLVEHLCSLSENLKIVVFDDLSSGNMDNLSAVAPERFVFVHASIENIHDLRRCVSDHGITHIAHLGAIPFVQLSIEDPLHTHDVNVTGTLNVLRVAQEAGVEGLVFASSCAVYGMPEVLPINERTPCNPMSPYAFHKYAGEHYLRLFSELYGLHTTALRFFNVFGNRQPASSPYSGVISRFLHDIREKQAVTIYGDGEQTRDFISVQYVALVIAKTLLQPNPSKGFQLINVGTGVATSLNSIVLLLRKHLGTPFNVHYAPARQGEIKHSQANVEQLTAILGARVPYFAETFPFFLNPQEN